ncbi:TIGR01440 family protein [Halobacillus kuroshimensis]|uniref:UPF0340 protein JF544_07015 n=1 Tax=Halobacillus kuroshimensis TaxID=302481 RepID=A0ABS3DUG9_9BACI|nr:TIGR01440 family protein [Halobacillus kuroshimensis]
MAQWNHVENDMKQLTDELLESDILQKGVFVVGCSTSEIAGERIGTSGSEAIAESVFHALLDIQSVDGVDLAFQCCEHLNRALVVERSVLERERLREVAAVPVPKAGGSMASYAFKHLKDPVLVEAVEAAGGLDIGDTLIGMHLKRVAVPVRLKQKTVGQAHMTAAKTRPPLIGGARAVYERDTEGSFCD